MKHIFAYTANTNPFPEFVSISIDGGTTKITAREPAKPGQFSQQDSGNTVDVTLPAGELEKLFEALKQHFASSIP